MTSRYEPNWSIPRTICTIPSGIDMWIVFGASTFTLLWVYKFTSYFAELISLKESFQNSKEFNFCLQIEILKTILDYMCATCS